MPDPHPLEAFQQRLLRLNLIFQIGFGLVVLALVFWGVARARAILARDDNARLVEAELRLRRGVITASQGEVLAESVGSGRLERVYPRPFSGPAVGYYSLRHGTAGIEAGLDGVLRGEGLSFGQDWRRQLLHEPQQGRGVRLTLLAPAQEMTDHLLGARSGAVILLSLPDAAIRAMVSHPAYDPNEIDAQFERLTADPDAALLNRATQGQYQPGLMLQPLLVAAALQRGLLQLEAMAVAADAPVTVGEATLRCQTPPPLPATWAEVVKHQCPAPMATLAERFGRNGLRQVIMAFGFTTALALPIESAESPALDIVDPTLAALGQERLTVSPLQMALAWAALAGDGRLPQPHLVAAVQDEAGAWQDQLASPGGVPVGEPVVAPDLAAQLLEILHSAENEVEQTGLVLSGPNRATNGWYIGLTIGQPGPNYLVVVVVEDSRQVDEAQVIGRGVLAGLRPDWLNPPPP